MEAEGEFRFRRLVAAGRIEKNLGEWKETSVTELPDCDDCNSAISFFKNILWPHVSGKTTGVQKKGFNNSGATFPTDAASQHALLQHSSGEILAPCRKTRGVPICGVNRYTAEGVR